MAGDVIQALVFGVIWGVVCSQETPVEGEGVKCKKDEKFGDYPVNIYYCADPEKPTCCKQDDMYTCCADETKAAASEQLQLWGLLALVVLLVGFVLICYRKDTYLCEGNTMKERCQNCCRCKSAKVDQADKEDLSDVSEPVYGDEDYYEAEEYSKQRQDTVLTARGISPNMEEGKDTVLTARGIEPNMGEGNEGYDEDDSGRGSRFSNARYGR